MESPHNEDHATRSAQLPLFEIAQISDSCPAFIESGSTDHKKFISEVD